MDGDQEPKSSSSPRRAYLRRDEFVWSSTPGSGAVDGGNSTNDTSSNDNEANGLIQQRLTVAQQVQCFPQVYHSGVPVTNSVSQGEQNAIRIPRTSLATAREHSRSTDPRFSHRKKRVAAPSPPRFQPENRDLALKRYRQAPADSVPILSISFLVWPIAELPQDGPAFQQQLDNIRLQLRCHIIYERPIQAFKFFSAGEDDNEAVDVVESALADVRSKLQQMDTSKIDDFKIFLAHLPQDHTLRLVRDIPADNDLIKGGVFEKHDTLIRLRKISNRYIPDNWQTWSNKLNAIQTDVFQLAMLDRLSELRTTGECTHLKVRMGICVFKNCFWESNEISDMPIIDSVDSLEHEKTDIILSQLNEMFHFKHLLNRGDLLRTTEPGDLEDLKPSYEIVFDIASQHEAGVEHQLHVAASLDGESLKLDRNWRKVIKKNRVDRAFEIFTIRFDEKLSWKLHIDVVPRILHPSDEERHFASSVCFKREEPASKQASDSGQLRFDFSALSNIRAVRQKTLWRTLLRSDANWTVEIAKYDHMERDPVGTWTVSSSSWDVSTYHRKWSSLATHISEQNLEMTMHEMLAPNDKGLSTKEAVGEFCQKMTDMSEAFSFWSSPAV